MSFVVVVFVAAFVDISDWVHDFDLNVRFFCLFFFYVLF